MDEKRKAISSDDRLRALALFVMAKEHEKTASEFERGLKRLLCMEEIGHLSDLLWGRHGATVAEFDEALSNMGIVVVESDS